MTFYDQAKIATYAEAEKFFSKCRQPENGRQLNAALRLYKRGTKYVVCLRHSSSYARHVNPVPLCEINVDNTLDFVADGKAIYQWSQSLVSSSYRAIPFMFERFKQGEYRVEHTSVLDNACATPEYTCQSYKFMRKQSGLYFKGMRFDLSTGECLNKLGDPVDVIDTDLRTQWLHDMRLYKKLLKARFKLGIAEAAYKRLQDRYAEADNRRIDFVKWREDTINWNEYAPQLVEHMRNQEVPQELVEAIIRESSSGWSFLSSGAPTQQELISQVDRMFNKHSRLLRKAYGVITDTKRDAE
jgi:hypothetical protein